MNTDYSYETSFRTVLLCVRVLCVVHTFNMFAPCTHTLILKHINGWGGGNLEHDFIHLSYYISLNFDIPLIISVIYLMPKSRSSASLCDFTEIEIGSGMVT